MEKSPQRPEYSFQKLKGQITFNYTTRGYEDLPKGGKLTALLAAATDSILFPLIANDQNFYLQVYQGYSNGMAYFVPGLYGISEIPSLGGELPATTYP